MFCTICGYPILMPGGCACPNPERDERERKENLEAGERLVARIKERYPNFGKGDLMSMRCKFVCTSVTKRSAAGWHTDPKSEFLWEAEFQVVTSGSPENKSFFASTPTGSLKFSAVNGDKFEPGKEYYLDLIVANG